MVDFGADMKQRICEFGFPGPLRDRLVDAVLSGAKTATSSLLADWERDGERLPVAGELQTVIDSAGLPVAIIEVVESELVALGAVDDRVARAEGESYVTAADWRSEHERFWREEVFRDWGGDAPVLDDSTPSSCSGFVFDSDSDFSLSPIEAYRIGAALHRAQRERRRVREP